jgi:hypothetical protein
MVSTLKKPRKESGIYPIKLLITLGQKPSKNNAFDVSLRCGK